MANQILKSDIIDLIKKVDLRYLLNAYFYLNPGITQNEIAKRFNVGQMTISRMLSKKYQVKIEWLDTVYEMLCELNDLGLADYVENIQNLANICQNVGYLSELKQTSLLIYDQLLRAESEDFEEIEMHLFGFNYFSWGKKMSWEFIVIDRIKNMSGEFTDELWIFDYRYLEEYFPKKRDRITFLTYNRGDFDSAIQWYDMLVWDMPEASYLRQQQHAIVLIDLKNGVILENKILHNSDKP